MRLCVSAVKRGARCGIRGTSYELSASGERSRDSVHFEKRNSDNAVELTAVREDNAVENEKNKGKTCKAVRAGKNIKLKVAPDTKKGD